MSVHGLSLSLYFSLLQHGSDDDKSETAAKRGREAKLSHARENTDRPISVDRKSASGELEYPALCPMSMCCGAKALPWTNSS